MPSVERPSRLPWWAEATALFVSYQAYEYARTLITGSRSVADRNAQAIIRLERHTWIWHERALQQWALPHRYLVEGLDVFYGTVHFVVPPLVLVWLWRRLPGRYARRRNTLMIATLLGLAFFVVYPLTPPRLLPTSYHFVDTMRVVGGLGPLDSGHFTDRNPYAAMPSLHLVWSTWCACAMAGTVRRPWVKLAVFAYPAVTLFVVIATANHYVLDAVGGWLVLGLAWSMSHRFGERLDSRSGFGAPGSGTATARAQPTIP